MSKSTLSPLQATTTWDLLQAAIAGGKTAEALDLLARARSESEHNNDNLSAFIEQALTQLAEIDEGAVEKMVRRRYAQPVAEWIAATPGVEESLAKCIESQRRHQARFTLREEADRYVVTYDPCGTGGRLRRSRTLGVTRKAYPWSWGRAAFPYYCCHCCIHWEILPIEQRGYPIRITVPGERPEDPCVHLFYKDPQRIPPEYYAKVGKTKEVFNKGK